MFTKKRYYRVMRDLKKPECRHGLYPHIHNFLRETCLYYEAMEILYTSQPELRGIRIRNLIFLQIGFYQNDPNKNMIDGGKNGN